MKTILIGLIVGIIVIFAAAIVVLMIAGVAKINNHFDLSKSVFYWRVEKVEDKNTRIWCLARVAAKNKFDTNDVMFLISEKNKLGKNYDLQLGGEILIPVFN